MTRYTIAASPVGPLLLTGDGDALTGLFLAGHARAPRTGDDWREDAACFALAVEQLDAYFAGELTEFRLQLDLRGTPFQRLVWNALLTIPYGTTTSYGELATRIGQPGSARAVGLANGSNPVSIIVPCHRVIGSTGDLTGYGWGLDVKRQLLEHEAGRLQLPLNA